MTLSRSLFPVFTIGFCALLLSACGGVKKELGLTRSAPDEFAVVKRAPLEMPPEFSLRPPQPGAPRPQEQGAEEQARAIVFGEAVTAQEKADPASAESLLLQQTGADQADPNIRTIVDRETAALEPRQKPVAERLLGWTRSKQEEGPATVVDAAAEAQRLKQNAEEGKSVTEGETPSVEQ